MRAPVCICNGVIRSGSTWSFNVCRELFQGEAVRTNRQFGSTYFDGEPLEKFMLQPMSNSAMAVIKAHNLGPNALAVVRSGRAKAVCTFRDPRDCIASDLAFMRYPMEVCIMRVSGTLGPVRVYQTTPHILLVRYEDMMKDRLREIRRIAAHLEIAVDDEVVRQVDAKTNMDASRQICGNMRRQPSAGLIKIADHLVDPTTHLHENHVNGGTIGRWRDDLSFEQAVYLTEYFAPWLLQLGYETPDSLRAMLSTPSANRRTAAPINSGPINGVPTQGSAQPPPAFGTFTIGSATARFANS